MQGIDPSEKRSNMENRTKYKAECINPDKCQGVVKKDKLAILPVWQCVQMQKAHQR